MNISLCKIDIFVVLENSSIVLLKELTLLKKYDDINFIHIIME